MRNQRGEMIREMRDEKSKRRDDKRDSKRDEKSKRRGILSDKANTLTSIFEL